MDHSTVVQFIDSIFGQAGYLLPEFALCLGAFALLVFELMRPKQGANAKIALALATIVIAGALTFLIQFDGPILGGFLFQNGLIRWIKIMILFVGFACLHFPKNSNSDRAEQPFLLLIVLLGGMFLVQCQHLLIFYLSVELISIASYVLVTFRFIKKGFEGGIKYLLFGVMSSGLMLYGISLIYGLTGSFSIAELSNISVAFGIAEYWWVLAVLLLLMGFFFKLSLIPFHVWTPDVYESAPTSIVALISTVPKIAVFVFLMSINSIFQYDQIWLWVFSFVALASIFFGNLSALRQNDAQRMMAYSTIAHSGTMLIAVIVGGELGTQALVFYLIVYSAMNLVGFYIIQVLQINGVASISALASFKGNGLLYFSLIVVMIALTGLPPTGGFTGKFLVFAGLWDSYSNLGHTYLLWLLMLGLANSVISLFYYLKIPYFLIVKKSDRLENIRLSSQNNIFLFIGAIFILYCFFKADVLLNLISSLT